MNVKLHIGLPKTGSTAIQRSFFRNRGALLEQELILYPMSLGNPQVSLAVAFQAPEKVDDQRMMRDIRTPEDVHAYRQKLLIAFEEELARKRPRTVLLSSEHLASRLSTEHEIRELHDFLKRFAASVDVYVYIRRQDELALSYYTTAVKNGETSQFSFPEPDAVPHEFYFDRLLTNWSRVFGQERMHVRIYDRGSLPSGDIVRDFHDFASVPLPGDDVLFEENPSMSLPMLVFLRRFNSLVPKFVDGTANDLRGDIAAVLDEISMPGERLIPGAAVAAAFLNRFEHGNRNVARKFFDRDELFPGRVPEYPPPNGVRQFDDDDLVTLVARIWCGKQKRVVEARESLRREMFAAKTYRAELVLERGNLERARRILENILQNYDDIGRVHYLLAVISKRSGELDEARVFIERALALEPGRDAYLQVRDAIRQCAGGSVDP